MRDAVGGRLYRAATASNMRRSFQFASTSIVSPAYRPPSRQTRPNRRCFSLIHTPVEESVARVAKVPDRAVISIEGKDTVKLLQGLVTNNVKSLVRDESSYCAFLNPAGRMLSSAFLFSPRDECVLLDIDAEVCPNLVTFIKRFKLRSKVVLKDVSQEWQVWAAWGQGAQTLMGQLSSSPSSPVVAWGKDVRSPLMGYRFLTARDTTPPQEYAESSSDSYTIHRILQGVPDGANDIWENQSLPLEANVDFMNGVDFRKGCYVGQELTARTHHTGVVRKRVIPISFYQPKSLPPDQLQLDTSFALPALEKGADVRSIPLQDEQARGKSTGKYLSGIHNIGLALLRLEQVQRWNVDLLIKVNAGDGSEVAIRPWIPNWWPDEAKQAQ